ncbi:MAG: RNA pseudouridine synthase [Planctomycetales bacterium]
MPGTHGTLVDWLVKDEARNEVHVVKPGTPDAREARLAWKLLKPWGQNSLIEIDLETGRSHQIRVQLSNAGHPLLGDTKYGSPQKLGGKITLHASSLTFTHPTTKEPISLSSSHPWNQSIS